MNFATYIFKRKIEAIFIFPFVLVGRLLSRLNPLDKQYELFFFFPFYHTGGAEKVHALLAQELGGKNAIVFFTKKSSDQTFLSLFEQSGCVIRDISTYTDNKWLYFLNLIYRGIISGYINKQTNPPIIFNGQCNFAYKLAPWITANIKQVELIHSFNSFSWIRLPFLPFISQTVMISKVRIQNHIDQYKKLGVPEEYVNKINFIINGIDVPEVLANKDFHAPLKVLYVGRGTPEKRVHLVAEIAKAVQSKFPEIEFVFAGDVQSAIPMQLHSCCTFKGMIDDAAMLAEAYQQAHVIIITSNTEGFPMVVEEAMAYQNVVIATPVGDLPVHIQQGTNGFLTSATEPNLVVSEMTQFIIALDKDRELLSTMAANNRAYAIANFSMPMFKKQYLQLLEKA
jgi:glycosyltransferase involved in cell wall biosynthesis